jgi:hypothetical protein
LAGAGRRAAPLHVDDYHQYRRLLCRCARHEFGRRLRRQYEFVPGGPCPTGVTDTYIATFGQAAGTGFPGGIVSHRTTGILYVNSQYGTSYNDGAYPGGPPSSNQCWWGFNPNDITNINMASRETSLWASNINFGGSTLSTNIQSFKGGNLAGTCITPAPVGGPMARIPNDEFLGVAAWPNLGN